MADNQLISDAQREKKSYYSGYEYTAGFNFRQRVSCGRAYSSQCGGPYAVLAMVVVAFVAILVGSVVRLTYTVRRACVAERGQTFYSFR